MPLADAFIAELAQETGTTRRVLARVPEQHLAWKPHEKSMSLGKLAYHIASVPRGVAQLLQEPVAESPRVPLPDQTTVAEILTTLETSVTFAKERLAAWSDEDLFATWTMTRDGKTLMQLPRIAMIRSVMFNHWYHHRGQLTVYLRMLDVALPSVYGPTADENVFA